MTVGTLHKLHAIILGKSGNPVIGQLGDTQIDNQIEEIIAHASGHFHPLFTGIMSLNPTIRFATPQIATVLTAAGLIGADMSAGNTDLYFKKATDLGTRLADATTGHMQFRASQAHLHWTQIRAAQGQVAEIDARLGLTWDGTNAPLVAAGSKALAGQINVTELFTLGPVTCNTVAIPVTEWTLESGIQLDEIAVDGEIYNTWIGAKEFNPIVLTLKTPEASLWTTFDAIGTAVSALTFYLRAKKPDGANYANADTQHVKFVATNGIVLNPGSQGRMNDNAMTDLRILLRAPAAELLEISPPDSPLTITTGSAIT